MFIPDLHPVKSGFVQEHPFEAFLYDGHQGIISYRLPEPSRQETQR
jgi:hypothetical protein